MNNHPDHKTSDMPELVIGSIVDVTIDKNASYEIWCKRGNIDILVLMPEMSWNLYETRAYAIDPSSCFPVGQSIAVKITRYVPEKNQYVASIKDAQPELDPAIHPGYFVGAVWKGKITRFYSDVSGGESFRTAWIDLLPGRLQVARNIPVDDPTFDIDQTVFVRIIEFRASPFPIRAELISEPNDCKIFEAKQEEWEKVDNWMKMSRSEKY